MHMHTSCGMPYRFKFGHIFMPWASRWFHSHHLKSSPTILTKHNDGEGSSFFHPP
ncbi:hypothetical protein BS47DRAFT_1353192 [Hydnum rufescens UP504]|uniref:Uncharacterized protein n=1 Tax=Hydnum rufescens UP504 TaxID=1448309 RepID=A0A9P6AHU9_9AGAM|nr:hypothetical protein BS47DRAFT_1353192 [Hydnum rufescens UP504]